MVLAGLVAQLRTAFWCGTLRPIWIGNSPRRPLKTGWRLAMITPTCWRASQTGTGRSKCFKPSRPHALIMDQLQLLRAFRSIFFGIADLGPTFRGRERGADYDMWEPLIPPPRMLPKRLDIEEVLPLNWCARLEGQRHGLPLDFVKEICVFLFQQDAAATTAYELSWLELFFALHLSSDVKYPVCGSDGRWISASSLAFCPPAPTVAGRLNLIRRALRPALQCLGLESLTVQGVDRSDFGIGFRLDGLVVSFSSELFLRARTSLGRFVQGRNAGNRAALARPL